MILKPDLACRSPIQLLTRLNAAAFVPLLTHSWRKKEKQTKNLGGNYKNLGLLLLMIRLDSFFSLCSEDSENVKIIVRTSLEPLFRCQEAGGLYSGRFWFKMPKKHKTSQKVAECKVENLLLSNITSTEVYV